MLKNIKASVFDWWGTLWSSETGMSKEAQLLIKKANELSIKLAVLSNTDNYDDGMWIRKKLQELKLLQYFEVVYTSASYGIHKPDPDAFLAVSRFFNHQPHQILMIGDSKICDGGAIKAGWQFKHVESNTSSVWANELLQQIDSNKLSFI